MRSTDSALQASSPSGPRILCVAVAVLLAAYVAMAFTASLTKGLSYDEGEELAVGYNIWLRKDFRMESANGDFVKRWATLPFLVSQPAFPSTSDLYWRAGGAYEVGYEFFFKCGNHVRYLLRQGRAMVTLLGVAMGLLIFICSRELFGNLGGLISLSLFVFSPHMLAFGGIVSTEMSVCLTLLGSTWCVWRLLHRLTWRRLLGSLLFFGLLLLAKPTALIIIPVTAILIAVKIWRGQPLQWELGAPRMIISRLGQMKVFGALVLVHAIAGWIVIWAHYDFRYAASPIPRDPTIIVPKPVRDPIDPTVMAFLNWSKTTSFLPQGYLHGIKLLLGENDSQPSFMNGKWTFGGRRVFFPYAMWVKTPPALLLLLIFALVNWQCLRRKSRKDSAENGKIDVPGFYERCRSVTLAAVYLSVAIIYNLNIGFRHILPVYPALYVLAGVIGVIWQVHARWSKV